MYTLWAFQLDLLPRDDETPAACLSMVRRRLAQWVEGIYEQMGMSHVKVLYDGVALHPVRPQTLWARTRAGEDFQLSTLVLQYPDATHPFLRWRLHAQMACDQHLVQLCFRVQAEFRPYRLHQFHVQITPKNPMLHVRPFLCRLAQERQAQIEGQPLDQHPLRLRESHLPDFVRNVLVRPDRVLPVMVWTYDLVANPAALHEAMFLLCQVAVLQNATALKAFTQLVGPNLTCAEGVRVFYPYFTLKSPPAANPCFSLKGASAATVKTLVDKVQATMQALTASRYVPGKVIQAARRAVRGQKRPGPEGSTVRERLQSLEEELFRSWVAQQQLGKEHKEQLHQLSLLESEVAVARRLLAQRGDTAPFDVSPATVPSPTGAVPLQDQFLDSLTAEVEQLTREKERCEHELLQAEARIAELETELANHKENLATIWQFASTEPDDAGAAPETDREFASVAEALQAASRDFADVMTVWESALTSARESPFPLPGKVYQALGAVAEVGREYFHAQRTGTSMGPLRQAFAKRVCFKFSNFDSVTTLHQFADTRVFHHGSQRRQMQRHLTIGGGETNHCLQIYFDFDDATQRVLIGYCGRHLPFARQRS